MTASPLHPALTEQERHDVHHALRMLLKHPLTPAGEERERIKRMADEIWNEHVARVAAELHQESA